MEAKQTSNFSQEFLNDYSKFIEEFDQLAQDSFQGIKLEKLAQNLVNKYKTSELKNVPAYFYDRKNFKFPNCSQLEALLEDWKILTTNDYEQIELNEEQAILCNIYKRHCQGTYLRLTFNFSRLNLNEDRDEPLNLARYAIRLNPNDFLAFWWYMITLGWKLDDIKYNPKERIRNAVVFRDSTKKCLQFKPNDGLARHLLGRYKFNCAPLTWLERVVARQFLSVKVADEVHTYQDAEKDFLKSHQDRKWLPTGLWMAKVLLAQKRPIEEVRDWINFGLKMDCVEPTTEVERRELIELDKKLNQNN